MGYLERFLKEFFNKAQLNFRPVLAFSLIIILVLLIYWRDIEILANEALHTEALTHIFLVPFLMGFLLYRRRDHLKASIELKKFQERSKLKITDELTGLSLCITALLIYWYGSKTFYPLEYHMLSLPIFISGVTSILFGLKALKNILPPFLFLLFLVPPPNEYMSVLGGNLADINSQVSYSFLKLLRLPVTLSLYYGAPTITLSPYTKEQLLFTVDLPCSGIYTFMAFTIFAAFLALIIPASAIKKALIFILGFLIFELLNIIRLTTIISMAFFLGEEVAMLFFHTTAGVILSFIGMLITLFLSEKILKINFSFKTNENHPCPKCKTFLNNAESFCEYCGRFLNPLRRPSRRFWAKLCILLLACAALSISVNAPVFAITKGNIEVSSTWEESASILPQISNYTLNFLYRDSKYERIAKQDASLVYAYFPRNFTNPVVYVLIGVANSLSNLHSWEVCLISLPMAQGRYPLVSVLESRDLQLLENTPIVARYLAFRNRENYTQVTLYWFEKASFKTGFTVQQKYVRISLIILTRGSTKYSQYENTLLNFGRTIAAYWEPIKTQALISLGIPLQQSILILSIALAAAAKIMEHTSEWRKRLNNIKIFNRSAHPNDKLLLQTIAELSKEKSAITARDINLALKRKTGRFMKIKALTARLNNLEKYGFIKRDITVVNDKPILVWKNLIDIYKP
ncbi:MAG: exosortase/archaeosortase family protein [Candidatus Bathyarchaeia archaeon]